MSLRLMMPTMWPASSTGHLLQVVLGQNTAHIGQVRVHAHADGAGSANFAGAHLHDLRQLLVVALVVVHGAVDQHDGIGERVAARAQPLQDVAIGNEAHRLARLVHDGRRPRCSSPRTGAWPLPP